MKYTVKVPPSKTEQTVEITVPDLPPTAAVTITGTTPLDPVVTPPPVEPPPANGILSGYKRTGYNPFDRTADLTTDNGQYGNGTIDTVNKFAGAGSFRSRPKANVSSSTRSEWQTTKAEFNPTEGALRYKAKYNYIVKNQCTSLQWHPHTSGGSSSPGLWHENGKYTWYNWDDGGLYAMGAKQFFTPVTGKWYDVIIKFKFGRDGYLQHYIDGVLVLDYKGNLGDGSGQYLKVGFNGAFDGNTAEAVKSDINFDEVEVFVKG